MAKIKGVECLVRVRGCTTFLSYLCCKKRDGLDGRWNGPVGHEWHGHWRRHLQRKIGKPSFGCWELERELESRGLCPSSSRRSGAAGAVGMERETSLAREGGGGFI